MKRNLSVWNRPTEIIYVTKYGAKLEQVDVRAFHTNTLSFQRIPLIFHMSYKLSMGIFFYLKIKDNR